jgi:hypothetical protein
VKTFIKNFLLGMLLYSGPLFAQQAVQVVPLQVTTTVVSGTISVTNTFQSIFANTQTSNPGARGRTSCTVQNNGTHTMFVFFGPIANATLTNSFQVGPGAAILCSLANGSTLQDQVSITGTATDAFVASQQ